MLNVSCNSHCFLALCCALHRITSRVIHRTELLFLFCILDSIHIQWQTTMILLNGKGLENKITTYEIMLSYFWYIMVRHNYLKNIRQLCEVRICLWSIWILIKNGNDPYAGSPTNTLLRLLLPLNDPVWASFRYKPNDPRAARKTKPKISLKHSIGSSDGRCVQRTGT